MWPLVTGSVKLLPLFFLFICASDLVKHDTKTQSRVLQVWRKPSRDCRWPASLDSSVDYIIEGGKIHAYKIQWFNGRWSGWFIPGVNDVDWKVNLQARRCKVPFKKNSMRRSWSYFYDHNHLFIISKPQAGYSGALSP